MFKRIFDLVVSFFVILIALPIWLVVALAIKMDFPGPVFYRGMRVGRNGKPFSVFKFRTMVPDAPNCGPGITRDADPRITGAGRFLRRYKIDEMPQLINVLKGEMSAVGPRPERPEFVEELAREIPFYRVGHAVKPGMAGWGLVKQGYGASKEDALVKLQYDLYYIKHQSLRFALVILIKTILDTIKFRGRA